MSKDNIATCYGIVYESQARDGGCLAPNEHGVNELLCKDFHNVVIHVATQGKRGISHRCTCGVIDRPGMLISKCVVCQKLVLSQELEGVEAPPNDSVFINKPSHEQLLLPLDWNRSHG